MRTLTKFGAPLGALLLAIALAPSPGWAHMTTNCPMEPAQDVPIVSGETYYGTDCVLSKTGDLDSFQFNASAGSTWIIVAGLALGSPANICMAVYAPGTSTNPLFSGCTEGSNKSVVYSAKLTVAGLYTIDITEVENAAVNYGLSLERLSPPPPDGVPLVLNQNITGQVTPQTAQYAFTFDGSTAGEYKVTASKLPNTPFDVCFNVYQPGGTTVLESPMCTEGGTITVSALVTPPENGTYVVLVYAYGNLGVADYNLELACFSGSCIRAKCLLDDAVTYASGTLTMNFTIGTPYAATWNAWLVSGNTMELLWSESQPITEPPAPVTKAQSVAVSGVVGVLSTLTTPTRGIACSSWQLINTGTP